MTRDEALWDLAKRAGAVGRAVEPVFVKQHWEWGGGFESSLRTPSADELARMIVSMAQVLAGQEAPEIFRDRLIVGVEEFSDGWRSYVHLDLSGVA